MENNKKSWNKMNMDHMKRLIPIIHSKRLQQGTNNVTTTIITAIMDDGHTLPTIMIRIILNY